MILIAVVVLGIVATAASTTLYYVAQSDREAELLFRGLAYQKAIKSYYQAGRSVKTFPKTLDDLLLDSRFQQKVHHLRALYSDPMNLKGEGAWTLIRVEQGGIVGVASASQEQPLRTANFPYGLEHFEEASSYSDWIFEYQPVKVNPAQP